jgi:deoxycytidine triphosphate deaminase/intein/homing endonuclease
VTIKADRWIRRMALEHGMIEPFVESQVRDGVISYGLSSYGYDMRIADEFKVFTNVFNTLVDPKHFDPRSFVDIKADYCDIPPNSFALARSVELFRIPRNVLAVCLGKCLTADTRIVDAQTGDYVAIRDFIDGRAERTAALDGWQLRAADISEHVYSGQQPVYRLTTRSGLSIKATGQHPFRTFLGWQQLQHLQKGDRIAVARKCPIFGKHDLPLHEAILLGLLLSDGQCYTPGHSPRYTSSDPRLQEVFTHAAQAFGCEVSRVDNYGFNLVNRHGRGGVPETNRAYKWLKSLGCNKRSEEKFVPSVVFRAKRESLVAFLQALFSGDGSVYRSGDGVHLEYYTISERLAQDVRHLLLRFGIFAVIKSKGVWNGTRAYRVAINDKEMIQRFACELGFIPGSMKQKKLEDVLEYIAAHPKRKSNFDTLPPAAWGQLRTVLEDSGRSFRSLVGPQARSMPSQSLPYPMARQVAHATQNQNLLELVDADVLWDSVETIEPVGIEPVYDVTVPGVHNFLANDFIVHNSTYARCGIILNTTPFEPGWRGYVTLELTNSTPLPARIYANEGIGQVLFYESDEDCEISYADKQGKYLDQVGVVPPRL